MRTPEATVAARLIIPLVAAVVLLLAVPFTFPGRSDGFYGLLLLYFLPPAGKETIIPGAAAAGYSPLLTATYIASIDAVAAWILAWNWDLLLRLPLIGYVVGRIMDAMRSRVTAVEGRLKAAFWGLVIFSFVPFQGSGAVTGTIVGRLLGLGPSTTWLGVLIGVTTSAYLLAFASLGLTNLPKGLQWALIAGIAAVALIQGLLFLRRRRDEP